MTDNRLPSTISLQLKGRKTPLKLTLPSRYQSDQWLQEVCDTLRDAEEVEGVSYVIDYGDDGI